MTFSNTNLEKLIQMVAIEQTYSMLQKLKENVDNFNEYNFEGKNKATNVNANINVNAELVTEIKTLQYDIQHITDNLQQYNANILKLDSKIKDLETELHEIKSNTNNNSKFLCQQIRGQQSLTSYPGFSNGNQKETEVKKVIKEEAHIKLKIEEKYLNDTNINTTSLCVLKKLEEGEELEEGEVELDDELEKDELEEGEEGENELDEEVELDDEEVELDKDESEEEGDESEEEVGTEDDESKDLEKEIQQVQKEEEEEEVFEIEIDDIPYFVTDEENGILYEVTSDGDIGKKVGIIKNGEPIFN